MNPVECYKLYKKITGRKNTTIPIVQLRNIYIADQCSDNIIFLI